MISGSVEPEVLIIEDTKNSPEFSTHPASTAFPEIGCYVGVPIKLSDGTFFGTLCAVDPEPKSITRYHSDLLVVLARMAATAIDRDHELSKHQLATQQYSQQLNYDRAIISSVSTGLCIVDQQGRVTLLNPAASAMLGWPEAEIVGKDLHEAIHYQYADGSPFYREKWPVLKVLHSGNSARVEEDVFTRKDGTMFPVAYKIEPIFESELVTGAVVSFADITKRPQDERVRSFLASIVESSEVAILGKTLQGIITSWNRGSENLYGYSSEEVLGKPVSILMPSENLAEERGFLEALRHGEAIAQFETARIKKDGTRIRVALNISPILGVDGEVIGASTIARDITAEKQTEEALYRSEEFFRTSFEEAALGMAILKTDGEILQVNRALCGILGYCEEELLKKSLQGMTHPDDLGNEQSYVDRLLEGELDTYQLEKRYLHKQGEWIWILLNVTVVSDMHGAPQYFLAQIQDISARKDLEDMKDRFVSSVSHELRTPLTSIEGYLDALLEEEAGPLDEEQREFAEIAYRNAERLKILVGDLLLLSKIESGNLAMRLEDVDIGELVRDVERELRTVAENKGLLLSLKVEPGLSAEADPLRFTQVLSNLVSNAIKFTPSEGTVEIRACRARDKVIVEVTDQGVGIPATEIPQLTERFFRASTAGAIQGTGLGLAITKEIVQKHRGTLDIESEEGVGSTFRVTLPVQA